MHRTQAVAVGSVVSRKSPGQAPPQHHTNGSVGDQTQQCGPGRRGRSGWDCVRVCPGDRHSAAPTGLGERRRRHPQSCGASSELPFLGDVHVGRALPRAWDPTLTHEPSLRPRLLGPSSPSARWWEDQAPRRCACAGRTGAAPRGLHTRGSRAHTHTRGSPPHTCTHTCRSPTHRHVRRRWTARPAVSAL